jgi:spermidine/putrescine transport system permease protein
MSSVADVTGSVQAPPPVVRPRRRWGVLALGVFTWLVILYSIAPIGVMVAYSFNQATAGGKLTFAWLGFTTDAYRYVFAIGDLTQALVHSLEVATLATVFAVLLGTPLALALARYRFYGKTLSDLTIFVDIAAPSIVVGASLLSLFISLNWPRDLTTIIIAHVAFDVAFVAVVVRARIAGLDRSIEKASYDLGAGPWTTFSLVTLPLIWPGIVAGALLAFVLSIDDFIITSFVAGQTLTFPLWVYGAVKTGIPPQVFAMGTLIFAAGIVLAVLNALWQRRQPA